MSNYVFASIAPLRGNQSCRAFVAEKFAGYYSIPTIRGMIDCESNNNNNKSSQVVCSP